MKLNKVENLDNQVVSLEIQVEKEEFEKACEEAYKKQKGSITVPGFRKGKAPKKMIEKLYGSAVFYEEAVNNSYFKAYREAVEESGIEPIDQPELDITSLDENGYTFTAKVQTPPVVTVKEYKGLSAPKDAVTVSEDDINAEIERMRKRNSSVETVDRAANNGDIVNIDYEGSVDGELFEGGSAKGYDLTLGSNSFIPGFEDQLIGASAGEEKEVKVTFPEDYHAENLKGKEAVFKCTVHEVKETILPELDDEFAKDVTEDCDTMEQLTEKIKKNLTESREKAADAQFEESLLDALLEQTEVTVPEVMIRSQLDTIMEDMSMRMQMQGLNLETYLQLTGSTFEQMREGYREQATRQVRINLALREIAKQENITVTDEDVENEYNRLAENYSMSLENVKQAVGPNGIKRDLLVDRALKVLKDNAVVTEKKEDTEEAK